MKQNRYFHSNSIRKTLKNIVRLKKIVTIYIIIWCRRYLFEPFQSYPKKLDYHNNWNEIKFPRNSIWHPWKMRNAHAHRRHFGYAHARCEAENSNGVIDFAINFNGTAPQPSQDSSLFEQRTNAHTHALVCEVLKRHV